MCRCIFNHFYVMGPKATKFGEITQTIRPLRRSRLLKVNDFGTNRKPICDLLLVINSNLPPILHRFQVIADYLSNFRSPANIRINFTSPETGMIILPEAVNRTIVSSFIWTKHRNVTKGQTDGQTHRQKDYSSS